VARIRYLKPETAEDTKLAGVSRDARLLYRDLWCHMDRQGITEDDARLIKRNIFPYDDDLSIARIDNLIIELIKIGRLFRFEWEGKKLIYCPSLAKHQKFHRDEKPKYLISQDVLLASSQHGAGTLPKSINTIANSTGNGELVTGNGQLRIETGNGNIETQTNAVAVAPAETGIIPKRSKFNPGTRAKMVAFIRAYAEAWKAKYNSNPEGLKDKALIGKVGHWIEAVAEERAINLVQVYLQIDYRPINDACHDLWQFFRHLNRIGIALDTGQDTAGINWGDFLKGSP
jgi:hypothetical protein